MAVILAGIFIAFGLSYYLDQKRKVRNEQRKERSREKLDALLSRLKDSHRNKDIESN